MTMNKNQRVKKKQKNSMASNDNVDEKINNRGENSKDSKDVSCNDDIVIEIKAKENLSKSLTLPPKPLSLKSSTPSLPPINKKHKSINTKDNEENKENKENKEGDLIKRNKLIKESKGNKGIKKSKANKNNDDNYKALKYPTARKIRQTLFFKIFQGILALLSFIAPGVLTFYDTRSSEMERATNGVTIPLVLLHTIVNIVVVFDNMNIFYLPVHSNNSSGNGSFDNNSSVNGNNSSGNCNNSSANSNNNTTRIYGCYYSAGYYLTTWLIYEFIKILLIIIELSSNNAQQYTFKLTYVVLIILIIEAVLFFIREFQTPRIISSTFLIKHKKIAWIVFTQMLSIYVFSIIGCFLFRDAIHNAASRGDEFIEGIEFDNLRQSIITIFDIKDWFNSYVVRAAEFEMPGSTWFFVIYVFVSRYIIDNLILAAIIEIFTDAVTDKLMLSRA